MKKLVLKAAKALPGKAGKVVTPAQLVAGIHKLIVVWGDYKKVCETERTERQKIRAKRDIEISRIQAQLKLVEQYFSLAYGERALVIDKGFKALDKALDAIHAGKGNTSSVDSALKLILFQIQKSPLEDLNLLLKTMEGPDGVVVI